MKRLSQELQERGFIHQFTGESDADLADILDNEKRTVYLGVDPTADSAHVGHLAIWMLLRHLHAAGHTVVFLAGGGTGMIGDPKPDAERELLDVATVEKNVANIQTQAERIVAAGNESVVFANNYDWLGELKLIDFLRDTGKHFTVNELLKKDAIASRLKTDVGLSYTEFAYPLLQGYDYLELHRQYGCDVQVGGSDQWGNIVAGVDLVRRKAQAKVHALTVPLVIDKVTGKKFGKSEGNAVWLDAEKTSPYAFYQFWLNVSDENVLDYLKLYTFSPLEEITEIATAHKENPGARAAQRALAQAVTTVVHGEKVTERVERVSEVLFGGGDITALTAEEKDMVLANAPVLEVASNTSVLDLMVESGLASSKREARTFVEDGAVTLAREKVADVEYSVELAPGDLCPLRRGKKQFVILYKS